MSIQEVTSSYAAEVLSTKQDSMLIDVRTAYEWQSTGVPLKNKQKLLLLSWRLLPDMQVNPSFEKEFCSHVQDKTTNLFFICKSGARSLEAADFVQSLGFTECYNIGDGFEGVNDSCGWKNNNLPFMVYSQNAE